MISFSNKAVVCGMVVAALCVGCGDAEDLSSTLLSAHCERLFRCAGNSSRTANDRLGYGSEDACVTSNIEVDVVEVYQPFIDAGTVVIDHAAADRCLAARRATCSWTGAEIQACNTMFVGQVAAGGGCHSDVECASGLCGVDGLEQCGACRRLVATGDECVAFEDACEDGPNGEWGDCNGGICTLGERVYPTEDAGIDEDCDVYQLCEPGLYCQGGTCAAWRSLGEPCNNALDSCGPGTFCREDVDNPSGGRCVAMRVETRPGEACGVLDGETVRCSAAAGLFCSAPGIGVCEPWEVDRPLGESCVWTSQCARGLECVGYQCFGERLPDESACNDHAQCASGNCVPELGQPFGGVCAPWPTCP